MNSNKSGRRQFLKNGAALAGLAAGAITPAGATPPASEKLSSYMRMASGPTSKAGHEKENTYGPRRAKVARATTVFETRFNTSWA